jgi:hypothetical protein
MNRNPDDMRFHAWLASRVPRSAPDGLLDRALDEVERNPRQSGRWSWPTLPAISTLRAVTVVPAVATVVVAAVVLAMVLDLLPPRPQPIAEESSSPSASASAQASGSPSTEATASGWASASPSASGEPSASPTPTEAPTPKPTPTPLVFPTPQPTPAPQIVGAPGTLTFRLVLQSLPGGTSSIVLQLAPPRDIWMELTPPMDGSVEGYTICGGSSGTRCEATTYELAVSGFEANAWIGYAYVFDNGKTLGMGQRRANGSLVAVTYPVPDPNVAWYTCGWDVQHHPQIVDNIRDFTGAGAYVATANMCIWSVIWEPNNSYPTSGTASLTRDGQPVYTIELASLGDIGTFAYISGYVRVVLPYPIPVARGQTLDLVFSGCPGCGGGELGLQFYAGSP